MAPRRAHKTVSSAGPRRARGNGPAPSLDECPWLRGNPEYEASKAARRNLSPASAVREVAFLSAQYRRMCCDMANVQIDLDRILSALNAKKIPFVLTGQHGIATWTGRPRATHDVDILVKGGRNQARAIKALRALYPELEVRTHFGVTAFYVPGETLSVIDVTYPHLAYIEETLQTAIWAERGSIRYRVPTLEAALANKYGAMLTPSRDAGKRTQDAVDFYTMVRHSLDEGRQPVDLEKLAALGEKVWPAGGGAEILRLVEQAKAGQVPSPAQPRELP